MAPLSSRAGVPLGGTAQRCTGTEERPQEKPTLLTPWSWSSGLQNFEKINLLFEQSSPRYITMAGLANEHVLMWVFPSLYILPWISTKHVFPALPFSNSWTERVLTGLLAKPSLNTTLFLIARAADNERIWRVQIPPGRWAPRRPSRLFPFFTRLPQHGRDAAAARPASSGLMQWEKKKTVDQVSLSHSQIMYLALFLFLTNTQHVLKVRRNIKRATWWISVL